LCLFPGCIADRVVRAILAAGMIIRRLSVALSRFALTLGAICASAADYPEPASGDFTIRNFTFETGESLPELRLHYRTLGAIHRNASGSVDNAVLILHGTSGSGSSFLSYTFAGQLFGEGQTLDAKRYFIILPDNIGHGESSKPSDGLHAHFPRYCYHDMIAAQYRLVTEKLGVDHLRLVMGTSMGGMHTWLWGELHPDFVDALMPLASVPAAIAGRNRMIRRMMIDSIRDDPDWKDGEYAVQPRGLDGAIFALFFMLSSPLELQKEASTRDDADRYFDDWVADRRRRTDANDFLYQFESSRDYDPSPALEKIRAPLFAVNSADDEVNPPELEIVDREIKRVAKGRYILLPTSPKTRGHGTHSLPEVWAPHLRELLQISANARQSPQP
jgi:homoserine O-acetyltransferase